MKANATGVASPCNLTCRLLFCQAPEHAEQHTILRGRDSVPKTAAIARQSVTVDAKPSARLTAVKSTPRKQQHATEAKSIGLGSVIPEVAGGALSTPSEDPTSKKWQGRPRVLLSKIGRLIIKAARSRVRANIALFSACTFGHYKLAKRALFPPNVPDLNATDEHQMTALMLASYHALDSHNAEVCSGEIVWLLLVQRAALEPQDGDGHTALHHACLGGCMDVVRLLVEEGADLQQRDALGRTVLMLAVLEDSLRFVAWLFWTCASRPNTNAEMELSKRDKSEWTALHYACQSRSSSMFRYLLLMGAGCKNGTTLVDLKTLQATGREYNLDAFFDLATMSPLQVAGRENNIDAFALLHRRNLFNPDDLKNPKVFSKGVRTWLKQSKTKRVSKELRESRALTRSVQEGRLHDVIKRINNLGSPDPAKPGKLRDVPSIVDGRLQFLEDGITPLMGLFQFPNYSVDLLKVLLEAKAELPGPPDDEGCTALHVAARSACDSSDEVLRFMVGLLETQMKTDVHAYPVVQLLEETNAMAECVLLAAASCKSPDVGYSKFQFVLSFLTKNEEEESEKIWALRDYQGRYALHIAAEAGNQRLVEWLIGRMRRKPANGHVCDCRTWDGTTPFLLAASTHHAEVCKTLVKMRADPSASDSMGNGCMIYVEAGQRSTLPRCVVTDDRATVPSWATPENLKRDFFKWWDETGRKLGTDKGASKSREQRPQVPNGGSWVFHRSMAQRLGRLSKQVSRMLRNAAEARDATMSMSMNMLGFRNGVESDPGADVHVEDDDFTYLQQEVRNITFSSAMADYASGKRELNRAKTKSWHCSNCNHHHVKDSGECKGTCVNCGAHHERPHKHNRHKK